MAATGTPDPIALFHELYARARAEQPGDPTALALATADVEGRPSVRMVLLKSADARGFVFYTNERSRKGRELAANPRAALCFYWQAMGYQVRVEGAVERVPDEESDAYFATRPRGSQLGAWASSQSEPLRAREELLARVAATEARFGDGAVLRPPFWGGYRVVPERIEIWRADQDRLHERTLFTRTAEGWTATLLQP
jgi:pyridoxamine 5'-phosphate oxidase